LKLIENDSLKRPLIWLLATLPFALIVIATTYNAVAQPGCTTCHSSDTEFAGATAVAPHSEVACVACHVTPEPLARFAFGFRQLVHMQVPVVSGEGREWASVQDARCLACHKDVDAQVVTARGIRIDHKSCAREAECTDCHSTVAHGSSTSRVRSYDMERCLACHVAEASTECDVCHVEKGRQERVSTGVFAVTHGPNWRTTHGMGDTATCSVCHAADKCEKCHGAGLPHDKEFLAQHAAIAASPAAQCFTCHDDQFCSTCHGTEMPHTKSFTRGHAASAKDDPQLCERCHADPDCTQCHEKHVHPGGAVGTLKKLAAPAQGGE